MAPAILLGDTLTSIEKNSFFYVMDPAIIQVKIFPYRKHSVVLCHTLPYTLQFYVGDKYDDFNSFTEEDLGSTEVLNV